MWSNYCKAGLFYAKFLIDSFDFSSDFHAFDFFILLDVIFSHW